MFESSGHSHSSRNKVEFFSELLKDTFIVDICQLNSSIVEYQIQTAHLNERLEIRGSSVYFRNQVWSIDDTLLRFLYE